MTYIIHTANGNGEYLSLKGHADYNPGNDVVCAGISTLTYTLINHLEEAEKRHEITDLLIKDDPGDFEIKFLVHRGDRTKHVMDFVMDGYAMIAEHYPDHVHIGGAH